MNELPYTGTSARGITKEIEIPVPWGIIAGKVFGDSSKHPVLCVHGWLANCNSFDTLIPLLPKEKFYVFIDLPGHGKSSKISPGPSYTNIDSITTIERIVSHFSWPNFSMLAHSLVGPVSQMMMPYASVFAEKVDKFILLEAFAFAFTPEPCVVKETRNTVVNHLKAEELSKKAEVTYSYEEARYRLVKGSGSLTNQSADVLLERGVEKQENCSYKFVRDLRLSFPPSTIMSTTTIAAFISNIEAETVFILAKDGIVKDFSEDCVKVARSLINTGFKLSEYFAGITYVEGKHHVHLCHPERVIDPIKKMLARPPRPGLSKSKPTSML